MEGGIGMEGGRERGRDGGREGGRDGWRVGGRVEGGGWGGPKKGEGIWYAWQGSYKASADKWYRSVHLLFIIIIIKESKITQPVEMDIRTRTYTLNMN